MKNCGFALPLALVLGSLASGSLCAQQTGSHATDAPHLEKRGQATQLIVDGKPLLMLAGELHNSSSSSLAYMKPEWAPLAAMGLNTVLTPVSWELIEPTEGRYDFALIDGLLQQAREQHLHLVLLWLASWKNGVSSYPPVWVKEDAKRFPRVVENGNPIETLSTFGAATEEADGRAFAALMEHLRKVDSASHTVVMMQVENEVGVLGASRDHSAAAEEAFAGQVPADLTNYLATHRDTLNPELQTLWLQNGARTSGTWTRVFGNSARADEIFMAWNYGRYVQSVAARGKAAYDLPMYVNAWLGGGDTPPGNYPSGGPQPRVIDVWKAAGNSIDIFAPDLYAGDFYGWTTRYHRADNPLFIPETHGGALGAANAFFAVGEHAAIGFSPFGIDTGLHGDDWPNAEDAAKGNAELATSYKLLARLMPQLLAAQTTGDTHGFVLDKAHPMVDFVMHGMTVHVSLDEIFKHTAESGYGLILMAKPEGGMGGSASFIGAGKGFRVSFTPRDPAAQRIGIASIEEGDYQKGQWVAGRRLNGDENDQGRSWRFDQHEAKIERATLYRW
ncbi:MAG: GH35 family beta-galactosidase [Acidobacteriaceae bacterium]